jgi:type II secretory pathway predicted ATPase ExeA
MRRPPNLIKSTPAPKPESALPLRGAAMNYLELYGLSKPPFGDGPQTRGYILFGSHRRAFELLIDHVVNADGVILLQGEAGIGKTATLRSVAEFAVESGLHAITISRPPNDRIDLTMLLSALQGQPATDQTTTGDAAARFLAPPPKVLLIDDLDLVPADCLRVLGSLSRRMPNDSPGPVIVLTSTAGVTTDANRPDLSQFFGVARNIVRLPRLNPTDMRQYIERSLWIAGGTTRRLITDDAMKLIIARAAGVPGLADRLMEAALTAGFARGDALITAKTIAAAVGPVTPPPRHRPQRESTVAERAMQVAAIGLLVLGASVFLYKGLRGQAISRSSVSSPTVASPLVQTNRQPASPADPRAADLLKKLPTH